MNKLYGINISYAKNISCL